MAPNPTVLASVSKTKEQLGPNLGYASTGALVSSSFNLTNASSHSDDHWNTAFFLVKECNGVAIVANAGTNIL